VIRLKDSSPLTVEEAAQILKVSKYTIYDLVKRGEIPVQRVGRQIRINPDILHESMCSSVKAESKESKVHGDKLKQESINQFTDNCNYSTLYFLGSHEPIVELLAEFLNYSNDEFDLKLSFKGSMEGLLSLYRRQTDITGIHLWDEKTGEYNIPYVQYVLPGEAVTIVNLVQRVQGFIVEPGNPHNMKSWEDLAKRNISFINRQRGSGTRLRIDDALRKNRISPANIKGYENEEETHSGVASRIASKQADVGIGVQSAAHRMGLDFVPLFHEQYDLVTLSETAQGEFWNKILNILNSQPFQTAIQRQIGYDTTLTGKVIYKT